VEERKVVRHLLIHTYLLICRGRGGAGLFWRGGGREHAIFSILNGLAREKEKGASATTSFVPSSRREKGGGRGRNWVILKKKRGGGEEYFPTHPPVEKRKEEGKKVISPFYAN